MSVGLKERDIERKGNRRGVGERSATPVEVIPYLGSPALSSV